MNIELPRKKISGILYLLAFLAQLGAKHHKFINTKIVV